MAAILDAILNFILPTREPGYLPKFFTCNSPCDVLQDQESTLGGIWLHTGPPSAPGVAHCVRKRHLEAHRFRHDRELQQFFREWPASIVIRCVMTSWRQNFMLQKWHHHLTSHLREVCPHLLNRFYCKVCDFRTNNCKMYKYDFVTIATLLWSNLLWTVVLQQKLPAVKNCQSPSSWLFNYRK